MIRRFDKLIAILGILLILIGLGFTVFSKLFIKEETKTVLNTQQQTQTISYKGQDWVDALTLLDKKAKIEKQSSGFVTSINDRKAEEKKKEFWAFYINGKLAPVGPKDYITKNADVIEWKIEKY